MSDFNPRLLREICNTLFSLGVPAHVRGYNYLVSAISLVAKDPSYLRGVTSRLYPQIATEFDTEPSRVERSIRNAIEIGFNRCEIDTMTDYFGSTISNKKGKATNSEFISIVALKIRMELNISTEDFKTIN